MSRRQFARVLSTALLLIGIALVARISISMWRDYSGWRNAGNDPSVREAYITFIEGDVVLLVLTVAAFVGTAVTVSRWASRDAD